MHKGIRQYQMKWQNDVGNNLFTNWINEKDIPCKKLIEDFKAANQVHNPIEKLKDKRVTDEGITEYLVEWKNLCKDSWVAAKNLDSKFIEIFEETDPEEEYEVEKILDETIKDGCKLYLIKWKDYSDSYNTWEPIENLDCKELMEEFRLRHNRKKSQTKDQSCCSKSLKNVRGDLVSPTIVEEGFKNYLEKTLEVYNFSEEPTESFGEISDGTKTTSDVGFIENDHDHFSSLLLCENSHKSKLAAKERDKENYSTNSYPLNLNEFPTPDSSNSVEHLLAATPDLSNSVESLSAALSSKKQMSKVDINSTTEELKQCPTAIKTNLQNTKSSSNCDTASDKLPIEIIGALERLGERQYLYRYLPYTRGNPLLLMSLKEAEQEYLPQLLSFHEARNLPMQ